MVRTLNTALHYNPQLTLPSEFKKGRSLQNPLPGPLPKGDGEGLPVNIRRALLLIPFKAGDVGTVRRQNFLG